MRCSAHFWPYIGISESQFRILFIKQVLYESALGIKQKILTDNCNIMLDNHYTYIVYYC